MKQRPIRVLCVDDHSFIIEGLLARFELERDLECVGAIPSRPPTTSAGTAPKRGPCS
jgi:DNA-binding NarL/FixJ family response regulator